MKHEQVASELIRTTTPGRLAHLESDVAVPVLQALAIAVAVGLLSGVMVLLWIGPGQGLRGGRLWALAGRIAATAGAGSLALAIVAFVLGHRRALYQIEERAGLDVDRDSVRSNTIPEPQAPAALSTVRVELIENGGKQQRFLDLPVGDDKLHLVARLCLWHGKRFSRRELSSALSQGEYADLAAAMLKAGLAVDVPTGRELTASGRAVLRKFM
jgi:hypothetical protein